MTRLQRMNSHEQTRFIPKRWCSEAKAMHTMHEQEELLLRLKPWTRMNIRERKMNSNKKSSSLLYVDRKTDKED